MDLQDDPSSIPTPDDTPDERPGRSAGRPGDIPARPLYLRDDWPDQPIGKDTERTPRQRFPKTFTWMVRWTQYADLMLQAANTGLSERNQTGADDRTLENVGAPTRLIRRDLDPPTGISDVDLGRLLLNECVIPALDEAYELFSDSALEYKDMERRAVLSWYHFIRYPRGGWQAKLTQDLNLRSDVDNKTLSAVRWQDGLLSPEGYQAGAGRGLEVLTEILDRYFAHLKTRGSNPDEEADPIRVLLPPTLADKWLTDEARLRDFRELHLDEPSIVKGIRESGRLEITEQLLGPLMQQLGRKPGAKNLLVQGPTSSGKSYAGRLMAASWVKLNRRAIMLLPIKALVTQAVAEWEEFLNDTDLKDKWKIVPGSRDYPQYDEDLVRGNYNIAVMIPEKLNALLARGMRLENIGVIIVDELQMVSTDKTRGPALEMLVTKLRLETQIPIVGLSALLDDESTKRACEWLDVRPQSAVKADVRPVPLVKSVRSQIGEQTLGTDNTVIVTQFEDGDERRSGKRLGKLVGDRARVLDLCMELLLASDPAPGAGSAEGVDRAERPRYRGVLCFVPNRDVAETYATAAAEAMQLDPRFNTVDSGENPYLGRFGELDAIQAKKRWAELYRIPRGTLRASVTQALRSGAGYHTARLEPTMRDEIERAFKEGTIRLLFATDTLMLGVNLPADAVVLSSLYTPGSLGELNIASQDTIAQRFGRAGRLGLSARGLGVIVLPSEGSFSRERTYRFNPEEDERALASHVPKSASLKTLHERALHALTDADAVFDHYVPYVQQGLYLTSGLTSDWLARVLLENSRRVLQARTRDDVEAHVSRLYDLSLKAREADAREVRPEVIVDHLVDDELMRDRVEGLRVTELGRALGRTGLPLADAPLISRIAQELAAGAGDLTLLVLAMDTDQVRNSSDWVAIRRSGLSLEEESDQVRGALRLANYLSGEASDLETVRFDRDNVALFLEDDVIGEGEAAEDLRELLRGQKIEHDLREINALLRACVMLLWMRGCPFEIIQGLVQGHVRSEPSARRRTEMEPYPSLHASDVRALGENCSYVFDTASDLVGVAPKSLDFRRFERMSESLSIGLPYELSLLARVNLRATHRERLVSLVPKARDQDFTSLPRLVLSNIRNPESARIAGRTASQEEDARDRLFETVEARQILDQLKKRQESAVDHGRKLHPALWRRQVPGRSDQTFGHLLTQIISPDERRQRQALVSLFRLSGLRVEETDDDLLRLSSAEDADFKLDVRVVRGLFTLDHARAIASDGCLVVACAGVSLEVIAAPLLSDRSARQSVVIEPAVLVETVAEILALASARLGDKSTGTGQIDPDEALAIGEVASPGTTLMDTDMERDFDPIEEALARLESLDPDGAELPAPVEDVPEGQGYELAGAAVGRILTVAPPLMTRPDMLRLIDGLRLDDHFNED